MNDKMDGIDFELLGQKLKVKAPSDDLMQDDAIKVDANKVIEFVQDEVAKFRQKSPQMDDNKIAVLIALKFAEEKMILEQEYQDNIAKVSVIANDALTFIEEATPT